MLSKLLIIIFIIGTSLANAEGLSLNQSRIIFNQDDTSQVAQIRNDTDKAILVQASVIKDLANKSVDNFIVTPPLFKVEPRAEFSMRIMSNKLGDLPKDRESIFYLKTRAIPSVNKNDDENKTSLVFVTAFVIKLIYRPVGIDAPTNEQYKKVNLIKKQAEWFFDNPTPYYMTVVGLSIDGDLKKESILLEPFSEFLINTKISDPSKVSWYFLNDFGSMTNKYVINSTSKY
ncbi:molecular chaperone [Providencia rettgeri]|uniref:fimbrial biogenesis chaperone n=1 Tax=Providencia rettgeri TaxID=587 RepID=UPI0034E0DAF9